MSFHRPIQLGVLLIALVVSGSIALAQEQGQQGPTKQPMGNGMSNEQMQMMHQQMVPGSQTSDTTTPTMPGQDAFGAIQEIVRMLEADPNTDWSKVNLEALRQHLIDMNEVTLKAEAVIKPIDGGIEVTVTGTGRTAEAIQRMEIVAVPGISTKATKTAAADSRTCGRASNESVSAVQHRPQSSDVRRSCITMATTTAEALAYSSNFQNMVNWAASNPNFTVPQMRGLSAAIPGRP